MNAPLSPWKKGHNAVFIGGKKNSLFNTSQKGVKGEEDAKKNSWVFFALYPINRQKKKKLQKIMKNL